LAIVFFLAVAAVCFLFGFVALVHFFYTL